LKLGIRNDNKVSMFNSDIRELDFIELFDFNKYDYDNLLSFSFYTVLFYSF